MMAPAETPIPAPPPALGDAAPSASTMVYVGNLPWQLQKHELMEFMGRCGQ